MQFLARQLAAPSTRLARPAANFSPQLSVRGHPITLRLPCASPPTELTTATEDSNIPSSRRGSPRPPGCARRGASLSAPSNCAATTNDDRDRAKRLLLLCCLETVDDRAYGRRWCVVAVRWRTTRGSSARRSRCTTTGRRRKRPGSSRSWRRCRTPQPGYDDRDWCWWWKSISGARVFDRRKQQQTRPVVPRSGRCLYYWVLTEPAGSRWRPDAILEYAQILTGKTATWNIVARESSKVFNKSNNLPENCKIFM